MLVGSARIGLTCTVSMGPPPGSLVDARLVAAPDRLLAEVPALARRERRVAYAQPSAKPGRVGGVTGEVIARLHHAGDFTVTLIKADGARMRWIKAPRADEPVLPEGVTTVLPVISIRALGRPLDPTIAHRIERVAAVTGVAAGEPLAPIHLARLLTSGQGALQRSGDAMVVPVVNMVDDPVRQAAAREVARLALAASNRFERVVLTSMIAADPVVEVVGR
jgi:probable selenium-dependent hydroxylase accessory protein YqeC